MNEQWMEAVGVLESGKKGDWNKLVLNTVPRPSPNAGQVLVRVEACSVNRADLLQRRGLYPPPPGASTIMGLDFAGVVLETAPGVAGWNPGERVFGIVAGGGYGRYVTVASSHLVAIPENLDFVGAAAVAEVFFTAFFNLFMEAGLKAGETLLVHGGGSGVGTAAIQLANAQGVRTIITAGSAEKIERCLDLGAAFGINYRTEDFAERVLEITAGRGVDVILDWIGASYLSKHIEILRSQGRLVVIGLMSGHKAEISLAPLLTKRLRLIGSVLRSQSDEEKAFLARAFTEQVIPLLQSGRVRPVVDRVFSFRDVEEAHRYLQENRHFGKIVLSWET
jgi:putative PIG3 family NAD(P)H quinone oxidoreductase